MVKFAHMSDLHLGSWKQQPLQDLNFKSFQMAVDKCIEEKVEFILMVGDLFDTPFPSIEILKDTFTEFKRINDNGIKCFIIAGSHDYSISGKTFLDVLERTGFCENVTNFDDDGENIILKPTMFKGFALYGYPGRKTGLEIDDLKRVKLEDNSSDFKILMLHTTIDKALGSMGNAFIDSISTEELPYADYYALGHLHIVFRYENFVYPGPMFPNNFAEIEELKHGTFSIIEASPDNSTEKIMRRIDLKIKDVEKIKLEINDSRTAKEKIISEMKSRDMKDKIILLRLEGEIENGKISDIKFKDIEQFAMESGAYFFLRNTNKLNVKEENVEFEIEEEEDVEDETIKKYSEENPSDFNSLIPLIMNSLLIEKQEGETTENFTKRILDESKKILKF